MLHSILWNLAGVAASALFGVTGAAAVPLTAALSRSVDLAPDAAWQMPANPIDEQTYLLVPTMMSLRSEREAVDVPLTERSNHERQLVMSEVMPRASMRTLPPDRTQPPKAAVHVGAAAHLEQDLATLSAPTAAQALASAPAPDHGFVSYRYDRLTTPDVVARRLSVAHQRAAVCMTNAFSEIGKKDREADVFFVIDRKGEISQMRAHGYGTVGTDVMPCVENSIIGMKFAPPKSRFIEVTDVMKLHV